MPSRTASVPAALALLGLLACRRAPVPEPPPAPTTTTLGVPPVLIPLSPSPALALGACYANLAVRDADAVMAEEGFLLIALRQRAQGVHHPPP